MQLVTNWVTKRASKNPATVAQHKECKKCSTGALAVRSVGGAGRYLCLPHFGCQVLKANVIEILPSYSELNWQQIVANKAGKLNKMQLVNLMSAGRGKARHGAWQSHSWWAIRKYTFAFWQSGATLKRVLFPFYFFFGREQTDWPIN